MSIKHFCDICGKETDTCNLIVDLRTSSRLQIFSVPKPDHFEKDVCVVCFQRLVKEIQRVLLKEV